jgi:hypothetical protein
MTPTSKKPPLPPIPSLPSLKERQEASAEYLEMVAKLIRSGTVQGFDLVWSENLYVPPSGKLVVAAEGFTPIKRKVEPKNEPVDVTDLSDMPECTEPDCPACKKMSNSN